MGRDKAELQLGGETLLVRQIRCLRAAGAVEVMASLSQLRPQPARGLANARPVWDATAPEEAGPILGLASVLAQARTDLVAVVAVDLPALSPRWWRQLLSQCTPGCGAVGLRNDGWFEPLAAVYPKRAARVVAAWVGEGQFAPQPLVRAGIREGWLRLWPIPHAWGAQLVNWNEPSDLRGADAKR